MTQLSSENLPAGEYVRLSSVDFDLELRFEPRIHSQEKSIRVFPVMNKFIFAKGIVVFIPRHLSTLVVREVESLNSFWRIETG